MWARKLRRMKAMLAGVAVAGMAALGLSQVCEVRVVLDRAIGATGSARLISVEEIPDVGDYCERPSGMGSMSPSAEDNLFAAFDAPPVHAASTSEVTRQPVRHILDTDPIYSSVAVDTRSNEVYLQDTNTWSIRVFNRSDNTPAGAPRTEPKRIIGGPKTDIQFNSCVYVDPDNGDVYSAENDIGDAVVVFSHDAQGNVEPARKLKVTHRANSIAVDNENNELFLSVQYPPQVAVYSKTASGNDKPIRLLQGKSTRLSDSHGLAIDTKKKLLYVNNWGNISDYQTAGTGKFEPASIAVFRLNANGDTDPLRVIQGSKTQLDWPGSMAVDPDTGDLYVANDMGQSILVFHGTEEGNAKPHRVIKGRKTGLSYPTSVVVDTKNKELWASNLGNSSATVYPLNANGDAPPLRTIRSAPQDKQSLRFGKTQAVAYDSQRQQVLVPN